MPPVNRKPRNLGRRNTRTHDHRNAPPAPPAPNFLQRIGAYLPYLIFAITCMIVILEYTIGHLMENHEQRMTATRELIEKAAHDKSSRIQMMGMVNDWKRFTEEV
ncbi:hypothetical protein CAEBREN_05852 [Caenorhabditis brenneri]|uniref:Nematode cuticle collagen N-terminal domain-containing protein n=1 Tax=Caenorhabditis brenneri TaxID=135651 RepID=G0N1Z7_CAEBE|nr:hypothetical protein CAEBREN_05852 [Caenorhabditis brenneri]